MCTPVLRYPRSDPRDGPASARKGFADWELGQRNGVQNTVGQAYYKLIDATVKVNFERESAREAGFWLFSVGV
jgi:hypothetical protein